MRVHRFVTAAAALILSPAFIVLPAVAGKARVVPNSVSSTERNVALLAPNAPAVGDGELASRRDWALAAGQAAASGARARALRVLKVTAPQSVNTDVAIAGVSWRSGTGTSVVVQYRTLPVAESRWSRWRAVDADPGRGGDARQHHRSGSEAIVLTGTRQVQVRVVGPVTPARAGAPADARLTLIDPGLSAADAAEAVTQPGSAMAAVGQPAIHSRSEWGADESLRKDEPEQGQVKAVIVHHTAGANNYRPSQVPRILRGIYAFHVKGRGWNDIGYNFLIDKWGRIWEGRAGGVDRAISGAHTLGFNGETTGISVMGDYDVARPTRASRYALARLIAWKSRLHGFPMFGRVTLNGGRYGRVIGHRNANQTSCPGRYLYAWLPWLRRAAANYAR